MTTPRGLEKLNLNQALIADVLTANGHGWRQSRIDSEIAKLVNRSLPSILVNRSLPSISKSLNFATEYVHGLAKGGLTVRRAVELIVEKDRPADTISYVIVEEDTLTFYMWGTATKEERYDNFRDAAEWDGTKCVCNMPIARLIHMDRIRRVRDADLEKLDVPFMKSSEAGDMAEQQRIAAQKQILRDIPQNFDLVKYRALTTLKAAWPAQLPTA